MIDVKFRGQTGNQLFQYCYGRLLADYLKQSFRAGPIEMFPYLPTELGHEQPKLGKIALSQTSRHDEILTFDRIARITEGFDIILEGYFEVGSIYYPYAPIIRQWFDPPGDPIDRLVVHVRGGDGEHNSPPILYYEKAIGMMGWKSVDDSFTVITDDPDCAVAKHLTAHYNCSPIKGTPLDDFTAIRRHKRIIIGNSTFAWWAAFLSHANRVIQPEPLKGFRSAEMPNSYLKVQAWEQLVY